MKEKTTYGLSPDRLARLLALGLKDSDTRDSVRACRRQAEVLQDILARPLPRDRPIPDSLRAVLKRPRDEVFATPGQTISDLLTKAETDLGVIKAIRDFGKELRRRTGPETQKAAATAIYYAAVASAVVFHQRKITRHSYAKLQKAYEDLEQKKWIPSDLKRLLKKAKAACQERKA